jgi:hypothetical protein
VRVLVVHPPVSVARDWIDYPYMADLGAVQVAGALRARGHEVALVDALALPGATLHLRKDGRFHLGAPLDEVLAAAERSLPADVVCVAYTPFHRPPHRDELLAALLRGLRAMTDAPVWLLDAYQSGQHYVDVSDVLSAYPEACLWLKYEAEASLPTLLDALAAGSAPAGVHRGAEADLSALALPAWDLVDLSARDACLARVARNAARGGWSFPIEGRTLPLVTSRGCPFRCAHCSSNPGRDEGAPKTQRRDPPERLAAKVAQLASLGATRLFALDELINVNARHFDAFLELVEQHDLRFEVPNGFRADYLAAHHIARIKGRATTVSVSAESGNARVLDEVVGKQLDLADIRRVAREADEAGVPLLVHWIIGMPGETAEEIHDTLALALELFDRHRAEPALQFATPLPGTRLERLGGKPALPLVDDWGPSFQKVPSQPGAIPSDLLLALRARFEARVAAHRSEPPASFRAAAASGEGASSQDDA